MAGWQIDEPFNPSGLPPQQGAFPPPISQAGGRGGSQPASRHTSQPPSQACSKPGTPPLPPIGHQSPVIPFRTFEPRTREQRRAEADKFAKEKARIAQRNPLAEPPPGEICMYLCMYLYCAHTC